MGRGQTKRGKAISVSLWENASGSAKQSPKCSLSWNIQNLPPWSTSFQISPFLHDKTKKDVAWVDWRVPTSERVGDKGVPNRKCVHLHIKNKDRWTAGEYLSTKTKHSGIRAQSSTYEKDYCRHQKWHLADKQSIVSMWTSSEVDLTPVCSHVFLSSVEYDFRQQEKLFLEVLNRSANVDHAHHLNFSLLRRAILKKVAKSKVKSKKLCKTLFMWLPGKIQHV